LLGHVAGLGFGCGLSPFLVSGLFFASTRSNDTLGFCYLACASHLSHNAPASFRFEKAFEEPLLAARKRFARRATELAAGDQATG
jgi:hypothetical protein